MRSTSTTVWESSGLSATRATTGPAIAAIATAGTTIISPARKTSSIGPSREAGRRSQVSARRGAGTIDIDPAIAAMKRMKTKVADVYNVGAPAPSRAAEPNVTTKATRPDTAPTAAHRTG